MPSSATLTLKAGPNITNTATVISNVTEITFDLLREVLSVGQGADSTSFPYKEFELSGSNTITLTASGGAYTLTIT